MNFGRGSSSTAILLFLTIRSLAAQAVEGQVVDALSGAPIPYAQIMLLQRSGAPAYEAHGNALGQYRIERVKAGVYTPRFSAADYWPSYSALDRDAPPALTVASGVDTTRLDGKLAPVPKISGRVLDGVGNPVRYARVWLIWEDPECRPPMCIGITHELKCNDAGEYSSHEFDTAGTWVIAAAAPSSWKAPKEKDGQPMGWAQTYYPNVPDRALAQRIPIRAGDDRRGIDVRLAAIPVHRIAGRLVDPSGDPLQHATVTLARDNGPDFDAETDKDGSFSFDAVADGEWILSAHGDKANSKLIVMRELHLDSDDATEVRLALTAPFSIQGRVDVERADGMPAPPRPEIMLLRDTSVVRVSGFPRTDPARTDDQGTFTVANLYPGPYRIAIMDAPLPPYYLDSIRVGNLDGAGSVQIASAAQTVEVHYKSDGGRVTGTVSACNRGTVELIPADPGHRRGFFRGVACGSDGRFDILAVKPGDYYAIALQDPTAMMNLATDDAAIRNRGVLVTVRRNETTQVDLRF